MQVSPYLTVALVAIAVALIVREASARAAKLMREFRDRKRDETAAQINLAASIDRWANAMELLPKYVKGLVDVCEKMVLQYQVAAEAVNNLSNLVSASPTKEKPESGYTPYDEGAANRSYIKQTFMAQGRTEAEAETLADQEEAKQILPFPAEW